MSAGTNFCIQCGAAVVKTDRSVEVPPEFEDPRCHLCKHVQPQRVCGSPQSPYFQKVIDPKDHCDSFVLNPAQVHWTNGMRDALRGDRDATAAASFEAAIIGGLPRDDEMAARFGLGEQFNQLVFKSGMEWRQCVASRQFEEAVRQIGEALRIDREEGYGYFSELLNRGRLRTFDLMCVLGADSILDRGDRPEAIAYLQQKVGLCAYLTSCPLLNVLLKLGGLHLDEGRLESAKTSFSNIVVAEPVDRVDEEGIERAIRAEARERLCAMSSVNSLSEDFESLVALTATASTFVLSGGGKYTGSVRPVGIVRQTSNDLRRILPFMSHAGILDFFVLAEHVPLEFTLEDIDGSEPYPTGVVLAPLNDNHQFANWNPQTKTLGSLLAFHWCSDGSMEAACIENTGRNFTFEVIFKPAHNRS